MGRQAVLGGVAKGRGGPKRPRPPAGRAASPDQTRQVAPLAAAAAGRQWRRRGGTWGLGRFCGGWTRGGPLGRVDPGQIEEALCWADPGQISHGLWRRDSKGCSKRLGEALVKLSLVKSPGQVWAAAEERPPLLGSSPRVCGGGTCGPRRFSKAAPSQPRLSTRPLTRACRHPGHSESPRRIYPSHVSESSFIAQSQPRLSTRPLTRACRRPSHPAESI